MARRMWRPYPAREAAADIVERAMHTGVPMVSHCRRQQYQGLPHRLQACLLHVHRSTCYH